MLFLRIIRRIVRLGGPVSAVILKAWYNLFLDGFYPRTDYCSICGFPIKHDRNFRTTWADAEILNLVNKPYFVYPICKHCREHKTWEEIYQAYSKYWTNLFRTTDKLGFTWNDIVRALEENKLEKGAPGDIKFWKNILKKAYKNAIPGETEFCGFKKGRETKELIIAVEKLNNPGICIIKTDKRTSIKIIKNGKRKKEEKQRRIIILPSSNKD